LHNKLKIIKQQTKKNGASQKGRCSEKKPAEIASLHKNELQRDAVVQ
jgi:hypothetical protein